MTPVTLLLLLINKTTVTTYTLAHVSSLTTIPPLQASVYSNQVVFNTISSPLLPPVQLMPQGVCSVLQLFKGHLLMASAASHVVCLPLNHPSIRFVMLMAADQVEMALHWSKQIRHDQHDAIGIRVTLMGTYREVSGVTWFVSFSASELPAVA